MAGQRRAEASKVRAAIALRNVVGKAQHRFMETVVPLHGDFDNDFVFISMDDDGGIENRGLGAIEIPGELQQAAFVMERLGRRVWFAAVRQDDT